MKIYINGTKEIFNIGSVIEKLRKDGDYSLDININNFDESLAPEELKTLFTDITSINVVRNDLDDIEHSVIFTDYTQIEKIQRKIGDETDITTISLIKKAKDDNAVN